MAAARLDVEPPATTMSHVTFERVDATKTRREREREREREKEREREREREGGGRNGDSIVGGLPIGRLG